MTLKTKLLFFWGPLILVPVFVLGTITYDGLRKSAENDLHARQDVWLGRQALQFETTVASAGSNLDVVGASPLLASDSALWSEDLKLQAAASEEFTQSLEVFGRANDSYDEVRLLNPNGVEQVRWARDPVENVAQDESTRGFFQHRAAAITPQTAFVEVNPDTGKLSLYASQRVTIRTRSEDGRSEQSLKGYLSITVRLGELLSAMTVAERQLNFRIFLANRDGELKGGTLLNGEARLPEALMQRLYSASLGQTREAVVFNDEPTFFSSVRLLPDFFIHTAVSKTALAAESRDIRLTFAGLAIAGTLITIGMLFFVLDRFVVRRIISLSDRAREIGEGNLDVEIESSSGDEIGILVRAFRDMSIKLKKSDERIRRLAYHDGLTNLPNRRMFHQYLEQAMARSKRHDEIVGLLFLDVDNFKTINDNLGHHVGDLLLREMAERLNSVIRREEYASSYDWPDGENILARLGGDEFVILLSNLKDTFAPSKVASRIISALEEPFLLNEHEFYASTSIGIAISPADGQIADDLIRNADLAMYHAKESGKNNFQYYSASMNQASLHRIDMEARLRKAIRESQFELYYQPQVIADTGEIVGAEALLRWHDPELGQIPTRAFMNLAEETGLILSIGEWVIAEACLQAKTWQNAGLKHIRVCANISTMQIARQNLSFIIERALVSSALNPQYFGIEITESSIIRINTLANEKLNSIRDLGVEVSLDDFGTGYSSLNYLRRFPIDVLKIDPELTDDILESENTAAIVHALVDMAAAMNLRVIAEGVSNLGQLNALRNQGINFVQGYAFSRPLPAAQFEELLRQRVLSAKAA